MTNGLRMRYTHAKEGSNYGKLVVAKSICILLLLSLKREREGGGGRRERKNEGASSIREIKGREEI